MEIIKLKIIQPTKIEEEDKSRHLHLPLVAHHLDLHHHLSQQMSSMNRYKNNKKRGLKKDKNKKGENKNKNKK